MSRINTNVAAMNAQRNIGLTDVAFQRTVGRLSSGFRINRAADDAAGLGIANQFRADIRALEQASANASQANSLLQVAEGATNQIAGIVDRMKELASQAASDNVNQDGRALIQAEYAQLQQEITRIVDTTNFQGVQLLAGGTPAVGGSDPVDASEAGDVAATLNGLDSISGANLSVGTEAAAGTYSLSVDASGLDGDGTGNIVISLSGSSDTVTVAMTTNEVSGSDPAAASFTIGTGAEAVTLSFSIAADASTADINALDGVEATVTGAVAGTDPTTPAMDSLQFMVSVSGNSTAESGLAADFVELSFLNLTLSNLGLDADASGFERGEWAGLIDNIDTAIGTINTAFGQIGAAQNRLDFAQANVATAMENFSAAESIIRDANFASEASEFARLQILQQTQISMLAQANVAPQSVLQLIQ